MLSLKHFRGKAKGLPDLLNYAALTDAGVVQLKDGSLLTGFFYQGDDVQSCTNERLEQISARANAALRRFGTGWAVWVEAVRLETSAYSAPEESHFPDAVSKMIDAERRSYFQKEGRHFETEHALLIQYTPPLRRDSKVLDMIYDDDGQQELPADRILKTFNRQLEEFADSMTDVVRLRRMSSFTVTDENGRAHHRDELVNFLNVSLTGDTDPLNVPPVPMYLDAYLGGQELWPGDTPKIGDKFVACVAIEGFPAESYPGIFDVLNHLAIPYRFSTRFIFLDQQEALPILNKYKRKWKQRERGFISQVFKVDTGTVNEDAMLMAREADVAITDANSSFVTFGYYTPLIVLMSTDRAELLENARIVAREIRRFGFASRVETVNTMEAWLGSLPGHPYPNVRRPFMHTLALADMLPLSSVWPGRAENPCPFYPAGSPPLLQGATTGATPFRVNLHSGDVGHTLIFGPTGAGKSVLLATLAASQLRYKGATITAFDKGGSMLPLCLATGGRHYAPGGEGETLGFCPLQHIDTDADAAWAEEWLGTLFELQASRPPTPDERGAIHHAISVMRAGKGHRSISDFLTTVQNIEVRSAIEAYAVDGPLRGLLDSQSDDLADANFSVFEIEDLMNMGERNALPVLLYLFRRFEKRLTGQPALLILDEAWIMLGHPVFREKIREWLKVLRKANCAVVLATQSVSDAVRSGLIDALSENCPTKIFLPNPEATRAGSEHTPGPRDYYASLGLNDRQIELLTYAEKKRDYYFVSPEGQRLFTLQLGPIALSFVAASDKESLKRIRTLHSQLGPLWPTAWLAERGLNTKNITQEAAYADAA